MTRDGQATTAIIVHHKLCAPGDPKAAQHKVHAFLWAGHKEADMLNRVPATTTALTSLKKRAWQEEAALDVWDTSSHTAARSGACLPAAACKRQCCRCASFPSSRRYPPAHERMRHTPASRILLPFPGCSHSAYLPERPFSP